MDPIRRPRYHLCLIQSTELKDGTTLSTPNQIRPCRLYTPNQIRPCRLYTPPVVAIDRFKAKGFLEVRPCLFAGLALLKLINSLELENAKVVTRLL